MSGNHVRKSDRNSGRSSTHEKDSRNSGRISTHEKDPRNSGRISTHEKDPRNSGRISTHEKDPEYCPQTEKKNKPKVSDLNKSPQSVSGFDCVLNEAKKIFVKKTRTFFTYGGIPRKSKSPPLTTKQYESMWDQLPQDQKDIYIAMVDRSVYSGRIVLGKHSTFRKADSPTLMVNPSLIGGLNLPALPTLADNSSSQVLTPGQRSKEVKTLARSQRMKRGSNDLIPTVRRPAGKTAPLVTLEKRITRSRSGKLVPNTILEDSQSDSSIDTWTCNHKSVHLMSNSFVNEDIAPTPESDFEAEDVNITSCGEQQRYVPELVPDEGFVSTQGLVSTHTLPTDASDYYDSFDGNERGLLWYQSGSQIEPEQRSLPPYSIPYNPEPMNQEAQNNGNLETEVGFEGSPWYENFEEFILEEGDEVDGFDGEQLRIRRIF